MAYGDIFARNNSKIKFMADLYSDKNAFSSLWYNENEKKRDEFHVYNPVTDDDSGKMLSLQKGPDRDLDSSLQSSRFSPMYRNVLHTQVLQNSQYPIRWGYSIWDVGGKGSEDMVKEAELPYENTDFSLPTGDSNYFPMTNIPLRGDTLRQTDMPAMDSGYSEMGNMPDSLPDMIGRPNHLRESHRLIKQFPPAGGTPVPEGISVVERSIYNSRLRPEVKEAFFIMQHPIAAFNIGAYRENSNNLSTRAGKFAINGGLERNKYSISDNPLDGGSERGAFRHALWQAKITSKYGPLTAWKVGAAHERNPMADLQKMEFDNLAEADQTADLLNNIIGREIGIQHRDSTMRGLANQVLETFYRDGLYTATEYEDGKWRIERQPLSRDKYEKAKSVFETIGENGMINQKNNAYFNLYSD